MDWRFLRPRWLLGHLLVLLAVLVCLRLGWWQWDRTHDPDGTVQNLGYAVLWPVFAAMFIFMWVRFLKLETLKDADVDPLSSIEALPAPAAGSPAVTPAPSEQPQPVAEVEAGPAEPIGGPPPSRRPRTAVLSEATVTDDGTDPELTAYNAALAALAKKDRHSAR